MNNQNPSSNGDEKYAQPPTRPRAGSIILVIGLGLLCGLGGGLLSRLIPARDARSRATVTLQTAPAKDNAGGNLNPAYQTVAEAVAANASPSVVEVSTEYKITHPLFGSFVMGGAGSGVVLSEDGHIVTNNHVVEGATSITVRLNTGDEIEATVIGSDAETDLAVIKIDQVGLLPVTFANSGSVRVGQPVVAIGDPLGTLGGSVTEGIISAKDREMDFDGEPMVLLQTTAAINPGNSGGGLFDAESQLVGVVNGKSAGVEIEGIGFAIPADTVKAVVTQLIENGYVTGRPSLGVSVVEAAMDDGRQGVYIWHTVYDNGLRERDLIKSIDGVEIGTASALKKVIHEHEIGDEVKLVIDRDGHEKTLTVKLQERVPTDENDSI